jgi:hypothetical protein
MELINWLDEGCVVRLVGPAARDAEIGRLADPWVGDEGPCDAEFRRGATGPLRSRGVAFDATTTVAWDEIRVQVVSVGPPQPEVFACRSPVLVRGGFTEAPRLDRVDYLHRGRLLASRYIPGGEDHA